MYRRLLDATIIILVLMQLWQWLPIGYEEFAEPDDTIAIFEVVEAARSDNYSLEYTESNITMSRSDLSFATTTEPRPYQELYEHVQQSTVVLVGYDVLGDIVLGAGVILTADGLIVTNEHIAADLEELYVVLSDQTTVIPVEMIIYSDFAQDIALLRIDSEVELTPMSLSSTEPRIGDQVLTLGHPEFFLYSLSEGIVSGNRTYSENGGRFLQITAAINYGSSGGPVFNEAGALIGLVSWSLEYDQNIQNVEGLNFALPSTAITQIFIE